MPIKTNITSTEPSAQLDSLQLVKMRLTSNLKVLDQIETAQSKEGLIDQLN